MKHIVFVVFATYLGAYVAVRFSFAKVWTQDNQTYVIFPQNQLWLYYLFRPLTYLDGTLTGMGFHIGPHR
ncbi:MAG: hypothetical protein GY947_01545 [Rhodobacteraceae bacterium]|nr:hypothetical protein [Paracoccaceae bacterium]